MWVGVRQPQSEHVGQPNARQVDWTVFPLGKDRDMTFILGHAGAVCAAPITTWNYPPTRWGPPYFCHHVRNHLDTLGIGSAEFDQLFSLIGHQIQPHWIFSCGVYVKNIFYQAKINDLQHLKARIRDAVATVTPNMLQATWNGVEYRLDICRATKGAHIAIYLESYTLRKKSVSFLS
jgi:hypothetical protein